MQNKTDDTAELANHQNAAIIEASSLVSASRILRAEAQALREEIRHRVALNRHVRSWHR